MNVNVRLNQRRKLGREVADGRRLDAVAIGRTRHLNAAIRRKVRDQVTIAETLKDLETLIEAAGLVETYERVANSKCEKDATPGPVSPLRTHTLRKELQQMVNGNSNSNLVTQLMRKARTNRLILVSKDTLAPVVHEACLL